MERLRVQITEEGVHLSREELPAVDWMQDLQKYIEKMGLHGTIINTKEAKPKHGH